MMYFWKRVGCKNLWPPSSKKQTSVGEVPFEGHHLYHQIHTEGRFAGEVIGLKQDLSHLKNDEFVSDKV